jgi:hypothetical protein
MELRMEKRRRIKHTTTLEVRLAQEAEKLRARARTLPHVERQPLLQKARQLETASHVNEWLLSPGLRAPE